MGMREGCELVGGREVDEVQDVGEGPDLRRHVKHMSLRRDASARAGRAAARRLDPRALIIVVAIVLPREPQRPIVATEHRL